MYVELFVDEAVREVVTRTASDKDDDLVMSLYWQMVNFKGGL